MYEKKKVEKRNMPENLPLTFTRTIYDPASEDFVFDSGEKKALPNIKEWIKDHNSRIYWYILKIDNLSDSDISQWAVELYTHQALSITEAYIEDIDRCFQPRKSERDAWNEKYSLSITKQSGIPIVGKGLRRIFFKIDINCKQGLMNEYGISGKFMAFMAPGIKDFNIKEKIFKYSCSFNDFKEIFNNYPDDASIYAEEKLRGRYSSYSVQIFTNTFRLIHELNEYCHLNTKNLDQDMLISKLQQLQDSFETVPDIAGRRISPLIRYEIDQLTSLRNKSLSATSYLNLCNKIVEYMHLEVMGGDMKSTGEHSIPQDHIPRGGQVNAYQKECPVCHNVITESNKSLICMKCKVRFCSTCEEWFREGRKRGETPLCEKCFGEEQKPKQEDEAVGIQKEKEGKAKEEQERRQREKGEQRQKEEEEEEEEEAHKREKEEQGKRALEGADRKKKEEKMRETIDIIEKSKREITKKLHEKIHEHKELIKAYYLGEEMSEKNLKAVDEFRLLIELESTVYTDSLHAQMAAVRFEGDYSKHIRVLKEIKREQNILTIKSEKSYELVEKFVEIKSKRMELEKEKKGNFINRIFRTKKRDDNISEKSKELDILLIEQEKRFELYLKILDSKDILS